MYSRGKDKYTDHKVFNGAVDARVQESRSETFKKKFPLRVQNDWSEHISSKGLIYYYNCRTEVSQWQKPEEWTLSSMPQDDIKKIINTKYRENSNSNNKRNHSNVIVQDASMSPKRIKFNNNNNNQQIQTDKSINSNISQNQTKIQLPLQQVKNSKSINSISNTFSGINKCKINEANFNNDDMDISPGSSPLSRGSYSSDCDNKKRNNYFEFETPAYKNQSSNPVKPQKSSYAKWSWGNCEQKLDNSSPANHEPPVMSTNQPKPFQNPSGSRTINKYSDNSSTSSSLTQFQISLVISLRTALHVLQSVRSLYSSKDDVSNSSRIDNNCLSIYHISDLLFRLEAANHNGETSTSYRSHRLQAQLTKGSSSSNNTNGINNNSFPYSNNNSNDNAKFAGKQPATIVQIKELVKCLQDYVQENFPNSLSAIAPVSPNYSKSNRVTYYLQILASLIETCLMQLCPQSFNSPSSTSSPGSLKDNNSSVSTSGTSQSCTETTGKPDVESPKKENIEIEKPKSVLQDIEMMKYVSSDVTNSYQNQLADYYLQEAQVEYYKFVRLHSVLYAELACESKKLKALVRISEINTDLLKQKKEDLEKLVQMLESRRLPNHLKCDYIPNS